MTLYIKSKQVSTTIWELATNLLWVVFTQCHMLQKSLYCHTEMTQADC